MKTVGWKNRKIGIQNSLSNAVNRLNPVKPYQILKWRKTKIRNYLKNEEKGFQNKVGTPKSSKGKNQMVLIRS